MNIFSLLWYFYSVFSLSILYSQAWRPCDLFIEDHEISIKSESLIFQKFSIDTLKTWEKAQNYDQ